VLLTRADGGLTGVCPKTAQNRLKNWVASDVHILEERDDSVRHYVASME
jgi:hypothetical protein